MCVYVYVICLCFYVNASDFFSVFLFVNVCLSRLYLYANTSDFSFLFFVRVYIYEGA